MCGTDDNMEHYFTCACWFHSSAPALLLKLCAAVELSLVDYTIDYNQEIMNFQGTFPLKYYVVVYDINCNVSISVSQNQIVI